MISDPNLENSFHMYKIITHPGTAHKDDFLTVSVLLATLGEAEVFRCEPTSADLADPKIYVVDVGMEYAPERSNFDHHQDRSLPCAFHLVMQHLGHHDAAKQVFVWYPHMSMMDVRGPYRTAEHLGVDSSILFASSSPIDGFVLSRFSRLTILRSSDLLYEFMKTLGEELIALISHKMVRLERLKNEAEIVPVKHLKAIICMIDDEPKLAMELFLRFLNDERVVVSITPAIRGEGWEMLRLENHRNVDFRVIENHPAVSFVHANGFLAKTHRRLPLPEVLDLVRLAITGSVAT